METIYVQTACGQQEIEAEVDGLMAIHDTLDGLGKTVTHIPTGGAFIRFITDDQARYFINSVKETGIDLSELTLKDVKDKNPKYKPIAKIIYEIKDMPEKMKEWE